MNTAAAKIKMWRENPLRFAHEELKMELDYWQEESLQALIDPTIQRIALKACVGPGKSAIEAVIGWWFLVTQGEPGEHPKGAAVSITSDNLNDNLWPEFKKWQTRSGFLQHTFTWNSQSIYNNDHPETWFISARSWPKSANAEDQGKTLSGLHSKYVLALIDESGAIPLAVNKAAEQSLSTGPKWGKIIQAGNPISLQGMLYAACTTLRDLWKVITITGDPQDPKRSSRIDKAWAQSQIDTYGRENPWVKSQILGEFPPSSINVLLGPDEVQASMDRKLMPVDYEYQQKRLGVDVAREGDDRTVLFPRQGLRAFEPVELRNLNGPQVASRVALAKERWGWESCFVDDTGGFGGSVIDSMLQGNLPNVPVNFSSKADDSRYLNRRAEMWFRLAEWVKRGGTLPNLPSLVRELTTPTYTFVNGKFALEEKAQIKKRLGFSPDLADALALTFAWPEMPKGLNINMTSLPEGEIEGFIGDRIESEPFKHGDMKSEFDPFQAVR